MEDLTRGATQIGTYNLIIVRPDWQRTLEFETWAEGTSRSFIRITEPAKERGVSFLKIGREMWQYVPRISRVIKIPPSMMMQSWMGSGFSNDDLVRESSLVTDYEHTLIGTVDTLGGKAYHLSRDCTFFSWVSAASAEMGPQSRYLLAIDGATGRVCGCKWDGASLYGPKCVLTRGFSGAGRLVE